MTRYNLKKTMTEIFVSSDNIVSPIGLTTAENFEGLKQNITGIKLHDDKAMSDQTFQAALFSNENFYTDQLNNNYTKFEKLLIASITGALANSGISAADKKTVLIISSTKGNVSLLETEAPSNALNKKISLNTSAQLVADHFQFVNKPLVISNACISGLLAILTGMRLIQSGQYEHAVVAGADVISKFVLSGFQSFQAVSQLPCKPFDAARDGINLGEGAATVILTSNKNYSLGVKAVVARAAESKISLALSNRVTPSSNARLPSVARVDDTRTRTTSDEAVARSLTISSWDRFSTSANVSRISATRRA